jgi:hypothetical protein
MAFHEEVTSTELVLFVMAILLRKIARRTALSLSISSVTGGLRLAPAVRAPLLDKHASIC